MKFTKYHGLGNDYLVIEAADVQHQEVAAVARRVCNRTYGIGGDGILIGTEAKSGADFGLRIINSDGSEAEKSGNGLRIFSRYLWDTGRVSGNEFTIETLGGVVRSRVLDQGIRVRVEMGKVSFNSGDIGIDGPEREVIKEKITVVGAIFTFCGVSIGNPHCVILDAEVTRNAICQYGPVIESDRRFLNRTNVQFLKVIDRHSIAIQIWERGAGYTLASGSSSTASAAVARKLGFCGDRITVSMPGGELLIEFDDITAIMTGPVAKIGAGTIDTECLAVDAPSLVSFRP